MCRTDELRKKPISRHLFGDPVVLFRDTAGRPAALVDRCAHRNVPLSAGQVVGDCLECPYHGWQFAAQGACAGIPGLVGAVAGKGRRVSFYAACEQQGYVWIYGTPDAAGVGEPSAFPLMGAPGYVHVAYQFDYATTLVSALENILDVPHTAFLHRGFFRGGNTSRTRNRIEVVVQRQRDRVEAQFIGEPRPSGIVGRLLAPGGGEVTHYDRFILPSIAQVEYRLGTQSHVMVTNVLTPVNDFSTRLYSQVALRLPFASRLVAWLATPLALHIARQDAVILRQQAETIRAFGGEQFVSTDADVLGGNILRLLRQAERGELRSEEVEPERGELLV